MKSGDPAPVPPASPLILRVEARSSSELGKHTAGPGTRFVFSDHRNNPGGNIYAITRVVQDVDRPEMHIEDHAHDVDSLWLFEGDRPDLTGLSVEVKLDGVWHPVDSPASIYLPAGVVHNYRFVRGSGRYTNIVLAKGGDYNRHLR